MGNWSLDLVIGEVFIGDWIFWYYWKSLNWLLLGLLLENLVFGRSTGEYLCFLYWIIGNCGSLVTCLGYFGLVIGLDSRFLAWILGSFGLGLLLIGVCLSTTGVVLGFTNKKSG